MKTILILHGWGSCPKKWRRVKKLLESGGVKAVIPPLPGFGGSSAPEQGWNIDNYVEWTREFCEKQGLSQIFLLGHSFGGSVAVKFAVKYPEKLKGLILCSSSGIRGKGKAKKGLIKAIAQTGKTIFSLPIIKRAYPLCQKIFYQVILRKTDYLRAKGTMKETFKKVISEDLTDYLPLIQTPTLIVWGSNDKITPLSDAYLMKEKIQNARLEILRNVRHCPYLERPELLAEKLIKFLS